MSDSIPSDEERLQQEFAARFERWRHEPRPESTSGNALKDSFDSMRSIARELESKYPQVEKPFEKFFAMLDLVENALSAEGIQRILLEKVIAESPKTLFPAEAAEKLREAIAGMTDAEQRQFAYLRLFAATEDAFGIIVRGHVMLESMIQSCIYAYVPNPLDLYSKLEMFFAQKVNLAFMLGIIDNHEKQILKDFNNLRNRIAHIGGDVGAEGPDFSLTPEDEEALWKKFVANPSVGGAWMPYDKTEFSQYIRYIVMALYIMLSERHEKLKTRRLKALAEEFSVSGNSKLMRFLLPIFAVKAIGSTVLDKDKSPDRETPLH
jgi:hypothetical protein